MARRAAGEDLEEGSRSIAGLQCFGGAFSICDVVVMFMELPALTKLLPFDGLLYSLSRSLCHIIALILRQFNLRPLNRTRTIGHPLDFNNADDYRHVFWGQFIQSCPKQLGLFLVRRNEPGSECETFSELQMPAMNPFHRNAKETSMSIQCQ